VAPAPRSLWPKEHGAYGQLALPVVSALAVGRPSLAAAAFALAAVSAFASHEALLVALGLRGERARRDHARRARRVATGWVAAALAFGCAGLILGERPARMMAGLALALVVAFAAVLWRGAEKTLGGEILAATTLSASALPIATASGGPVAAAIALWGAWVAIFVATTAAVRWVIGRHKRERASVMDLAALLVTTAATAAASARVPLVRAALPLVLVAWGLVALRPHPRHLRRVGWVLAGCTTATAALLVALARGAL
jgi:hypothetical protein